MIDPSGTVSHGSAVWFSEVHAPLQHYLVVARGRKGLELPDILSNCGEEVLPVFSSEEAAQEFLSLSSLGKRWYVRGFLRGTSLGSLCLSCENRGSPDRSAPWSSLGRRGGIRCGATCFREFTARTPKPPTCPRCTSLASDPTDPSQTPDPRIG